MPNFAYFAIPETHMHILGIKVRIHWTFSLIILYIIYVNASAGQNAGEIAWAVLFVLSLFACVTLHEFGHALTAKRYGIKTTDITLYPIGGVARLEKMPEKPKQELLVAIAGPMVNLVITAVMLPFLLRYDFAADAETKALVIGSSNFLPMLGVINLWLALFNLIPAFPMDGGRVLRALLSVRMGRLRATQTAANIGKIVAIGFVILGFYSNPFLIFIGLFVILGAQAEAEMVKTQTFMSGLKAADALMTTFPSLDRAQPLGEAVKKLLDGEAKNFLVTANGEPYGVLGRDQIIKGISSQGENTAIEQVADPKLEFADVNTPLEEVFSRMQRSKTALLLVRSGGRLVGVIDADNIAERIMVQMARTGSPGNT